MILIFNNLTTFGQSFKEAQKKYPRVRDAYESKESTVKALLKAHQITAPYQLFWRAFKDEGLFELWAKGASQTKFTLVKTYKICEASGVLGPKRKLNDLQVPEGFYHVNHFNPNSNFLLSFGINYPNASDRVLSNKKSPGGNIYIHGSCVTLGCIPLTDDCIQEIYVMAVEAKNSGQTQIPVHIFPFKMTSEHCKRFYEEYKANPNLVSFWKNIEKGYSLFEENKIPPKFTVNQKGQYVW
ncbi:MAG: hypothetical protein EAZ57_05960 [Cytophagales bacterium]|nr:MAG: hypothetical protein EAZ67_08150 [Cytophagales bacterium]TAF60796.1 MAG: hypothetical protein EAZ57_05960 [Cytophagales bacterium]